MVRFIIDTAIKKGEGGSKFTFHYGQIYYDSGNRKDNHIDKIYIPLWLDLLYLIAK